MKILFKQHLSVTQRLLCALSVGLVFLCSSYSAFAVNVNKANAEEIAASLTGVGPVLANAIVQYRTDNGPFESLDQFIAVKGIGKHIVETNLDSIEFSDTVIANQ